MPHFLKKIEFWIASTIVFAACDYRRPDTMSSSEVSLQDSVMVDAQQRVYRNGKREYLEYKPFITRVIQKVPEESPEKTIYGGLKALKLDSTGFFHVQKVEDRWWAVDPTGHAFIHIAINSLNTGDSERNKKALQEKFGDDQGWIVETARMLQKYGFNGTGSWSDVELVRYANQQLEHPLSYTINLSFMSSYGDERGGTWQVPGHKAYPNDAIFVFDPEFKTFADQHAQQLVEFKDDPNVFGYFSDNEMPFKHSAILDYLSLENKEDPGYLAARKWLEERGINQEKIDDQIKDEFMAYVAETYFSIVASALKKYDPNHMYLGARFYSSEKHNQAFMEAAGKYVDIVSNNYYGRWTPKRNEMKQWAEWTGKPFIITEYYTKGEDSGMPNQSGAGWIVRTQKDRGLFYQNFCLALLENNHCVGWHYFKYQDNDPTLEGAEPSNIDSNKGIVNNYYEPWVPMLEEMHELNTNVYELIDYFQNDQLEGI